MNLGPTFVFSPSPQNLPVYGTNVSGPTSVNKIRGYQSSWLSHFPVLDFRCLFAPELGTTMGYQSSYPSQGLGVNTGLVIKGVARHPFTGAGY